MFTIAFFASFLATFSLASSFVSQTSPCPWNGVASAGNFTLLAVFKMDNGTREPLVLGSNGPDDGFNPSSLAWLGVFILPFLRNDWWLTCHFINDTERRVHQFSYREILRPD